jgi:catechol 2,3-dioxygenase-like lactoylglutathione lyase family enzyme
MTARISYLTILSEDNYALARFYQGFFHLHPTGDRAPTEFVRVSDGQIALNLKPRLAGYRAQFDHFGIEVDDISDATARIREAYPQLQCLARSPDDPLASVSAHDPDGNYFGLYQRGSSANDDIPEAGSWAQKRVIDHIALRVPRPELVAEFYSGVFGLKPVDGPSGGGTLYLSDGNITLVIIPWDMNDFLDTGITARGMDHIGFRVESIAALKADIERVTAENYRFQPGTSILGRGKEGAGRLAMFKRTCPLGRHHMSDSDGLLLDVVE